MLDCVTSIHMSSVLYSSHCFGEGRCFTHRQHCERLCVWHSFWVLLGYSSFGQNVPEHCQIFAHCFPLRPLEGRGVSWSAFSFIFGASWSHRFTSVKGIYRYRVSISSWINHRFLMMAPKLILFEVKLVLTVNYYRQECRNWTARSKHLTLLCPPASWANSDYHWYKVVQL